MSAGKPSCAAIIPARGGSKGIPGKNLQRVGGVPLIARAIAACREAQLVGNVYVSTDDNEIARVAADFGAEIIERPSDLAGDSASSESALLHALDVVEKRLGAPPKVTAFVQCTSPFIAGADVDGTIRPVLAGEADTSLSIAEFHRFVWTIETSGALMAVGHDKSVRPRRQERAPQFVETGAVYAFDTEGFRAARHRFFGKTVGHIVPPERAMEIDDAADLQLAEALIRLHDQSAAPRAPEPIDAVIFDFDGVFTDDRVLVSEARVEAVWCSRADGLGIELFAKTGIPMAIISKERNPVVAARAEKLKIEVFQGVDAKADLLRKLAEVRGWRLDHLVYVGNDVTDIECLAMCGLGVTPADAHPRAKEAARWVLSKPGGCGAVRELLDTLALQASK